MSDVFGRQPVLELLRSGREINRLLVAKGQRRGSIREILAVAKELGVTVQEVDRGVLDRMSKRGNHQGVLAQAAAVPYWSLEQVLAQKTDPDWPFFLVLLDGIEDPHNLGALLRIGEALGIHAVVIPKRRAVGVTPAVMKTSAGAANYVPVCRVGNLVRAMELLKKAGLWIAGADREGEICWKQDLRGPLALVLGGEGQGLSRLVKEKCDFLSSIPQRGRVHSLNASVAGAMLMFEVLRQRGSKAAGP